jgi:hypothetical protein
MKDKLIGEMTINEVYPHLNAIAKAYNLKLNRLNDFRFARLVLVNLYCRELC